MIYMTYLLPIPGTEIVVVSTKWYVRLRVVRRDGHPDQGNGSCAVVVYSKPMTMFSSFRFQIVYQPCPSAVNVQLHRSIAKRAVPPPQQKHKILKIIVSIPFRGPYLSTSTTEDLFVF
jgi:hypothetical protein